MNPWTGDVHIAMPVPTQNYINIKNSSTTCQTFIPQVRLKFDSNYRKVYTFNCVTFV
jgi:hypothetical protein